MTDPNWTDETFNTPEYKAGYAQAIKDAADLCHNNEVGTASGSGYVMHKRLHADNGTHAGEEYARRIAALSQGEQS